MLTQLDGVIRLVNLCFLALCFYLSVNVNTQRKHERKRAMSSLAADHLVAEDRVNV